MDKTLDDFSPKKNDLILTVAKYQGLTIKGIDDKAGYAEVDKARKELKNKRVEIEKAGKVLRADALAYQKSVIKLEKELISIIEPLELELKAKQDEIDRERTLELRRQQIPERREKLQSYAPFVEEAFLLNLDDAAFEKFLLGEQAIYLHNKELELQRQEAALKPEDKSIELTPETLEVNQEFMKKSIDEGLNTPIPAQVVINPNNVDWKLELRGMIKAHYANYKGDEGEVIKEFREDIYNTTELEYFIAQQIAKAFKRGYLKGMNAEAV